MATSVTTYPEYRSDITVDGYTYQVTVQFPGKAQPETGLLPHSHSRFELHAVARGTVVLQMEEQPTICLQAGECGILPPNTYHLRRFLSEDTKCFSMFIARPKGAPLRMQAPGRMVSSPALITYFTRLEEEFTVRRVGTDKAMDSLTAMLLITVLRELAGLPEQPRPRKIESLRQRDDLIDNFFASHYGYPITAGELAQRLGVTTRQLARIMQHRYGCTFRQRLLEIRLYNAKRYLTASDMSICSIAAECGFESQSAFATAFRKQTGCSPSQYRRQKERGNS